MNDRPPLPAPPGLGSAGHWPEYLAEAAGLGGFMVAAAVFAVILEHPDSPVRAAIGSPGGRRALMGLAMALTALGIVHSAWGRRSGAHLNPAVTLTFLSLGRVAPRDALAYVLAQVLGALIGMGTAAVVLGRALGHPAVNYVVTVPGPPGAEIAFVAELAIAFVLMTVVLEFSGRPALAPWTGAAAAFCVFLFITLEAPLSGMGLNPARSLASAVVAGEGRGLWVYLVAPPMGMLLAAGVHARLRNRPVACGKLDHRSSAPCLFCDYRRTRNLPTTREVVEPSAAPVRRV